MIWWLILLYSIIQNCKKLFGEDKHFAKGKWIYSHPPMDSLSQSARIEKKDSKPNVTLMMNVIAFSFAILKLQCILILLLNCCYFTWWCQCWFFFSCCVCIILSCSKFDNHNLDPPNSVIAQEGSSWGFHSGQCQRCVWQLQWSRQYDGQLWWLHYSNLSLKKMVSLTDLERKQNACSLGFKQMTTSLSKKEG